MGEIISGYNEATRVDSLNKPFSSLDFKEAERVAKEPLVFSKEAVTFLGKENVALLTQEFASPEIEAIDTLCLAGEMSVQEVLEYAILIPEIRAVFDRVSDRVSRMSAFIRERKMANYLSRVERREGRTREYDSRPIDTFFDATPDFLTYTAKKMNAGRFVAQTLLGFVSQEMYRDLTADVYRELERMGSHSFFAIINDFKKRGAIQSSAEQGLSNGEALAMMWFVERAPIKAGLVSEIARLAIDTSKLPELFNEISDLSVYRTINFTHRIGALEFDFHAGDDNSLEYQLGKRLPEICSIIVRKNDTNSAGPENVLPLLLERFTGELNTTMVARLSGHLGVDAERRLRTELFIALRDYLVAKEEDIESVAPVLLRERPVVKEILEGESLLPEENENESSVSRPLSAESVGVSRTAEELDVVKKKEQPKRQTTLRDLKGITGGRIKEALCALLGKPVRVSSSHHVFACRSGGTFPIPLHESATVGTGILGKCLKRFGVTPAELKEQLS